MRRLWSDARSKTEAEGMCRCRALGGCQGPIETAHTIGRKYDLEVSPGVFYVDPDDTVPLCGHRHHRLFDAGQLDLLPFLDPLGPPYREQAAAVRHIGLERASRRLAPSVARAVEGLAAAAEEATELGGAA